MRSTIIAAIAALAFATVTHAAANSAAGPYHLDHNRRCHAANGALVPDNFCVAAPVCNPARSKPCGHTCIALDKTCPVNGVAVVRKAGGTQ
ncbi:MAG TPA: hypothetical protein VMT68_15350 [Caulobacteraceae bacterium]|nr:hypothetical protein [Caulobacteraceae bacterium]